MKRRGWSLLETLFVVALAALMLAGSMAAFREPTSRTSSRGLADQLAEGLRNARNLAIADQGPVGLVLPTAGVHPCSQSLGFLRGEENPALVRVLDYQQEFPQAVIFVGTYPAAGSWSKDAPASGRSRFLQTAMPSFPGTEPLRVWLQGRNDFLFLFGPDGRVHTNDVPQLNGNYHLVVSQGVTTRPAGVAGSGMGLGSPPPYHELTAACNPYTVIVSPLGAVQVIPGLAGANPALSISPGALPLNNVASALAAVQEPVTNPSLVSVTTFPQSTAFAAGLGVDATVHPERSLTLAVRAKINTSDELFCSMTAIGERGGTPVGAGAFSSDGAKRMRFYPPFPPLITEGTWVSNWQWTPPEGAIHNDNYRFEVRVSTRRGGLVTSNGNAVFEKRVRIYDRGRIFFGAVDPYNPRFQIYSVKADGTDLQRLTGEETLSAQQVYPSATRDGAKMLFCGTDFSTVGSLYALSRGGGLSTQVTSTATLPGVIAFRANFADDTSVCVFDGDSGGRYELFNFVPGLVWPPASERIFSDAPAGGQSSPAISNIIDFPNPQPAPFHNDPSSDARYSKPRRLAFDMKVGSNRAIYTCFYKNPHLGPKQWADAKVVQMSEGCADSGGDTGDRYPCWNPYGRTGLAFQSSRSGKPAIWVMAPDKNVDDGKAGNDGAVCISNSLARAMHPWWSPWGDAICYIGYDSVLNEWDIYVQGMRCDDDLTDNGGVPFTPVPQGPPYRLSLKSQLPFSGGFVFINKPCWSL